MLTLQEISDRLEIQQLLVDRNGILPSEIGRLGLAEAPGAVAHRATQRQGGAAPDRFRARPVQHLRHDLDAGGG